MLSLIAGAIVRNWSGPAIGTALQECEGSLNMLEFLEQSNRASGRKAVPFEYKRDSDGDDNELRNDGLGVALLERPHCCLSTS